VANGDHRQLKRPSRRERVLNWEKRAGSTGRDQRGGRGGEQARNQPKRRGTRTVQGRDKLQVTKTQQRGGTGRGRPTESVDKMGRNRRTRRRPEKKKLLDERVADALVKTVAFKTLTRRPSSHQGENQGGIKVKSRRRKELQRELAPAGRQRTQNLLKNRRRLESPRCGRKRRVGGSNRTREGA